MKIIFTIRYLRSNLIPKDVRNIFSLFTLFTSNLASKPNDFSTWIYNIHFLVKDPMQRE